MLKMLKMLKKILDITTILLVLLGGGMHVFRLIYYLFKPKFLLKFEKRFFTPGKDEHILYCILVIVGAVYALKYKLARL